MSTSVNVLLLESITDEAYEILEADATIITAPAPDRGREVIGDHKIHGILTRGKGAVDPSLIDACSGLKAIARCGVGLDNVAVSHASAHGIKVINAPGVNADTVAEHTLALMLTTQRKMIESITSVNAGRWSDRKHYTGDEIRGKTLGIIGMGDIGLRVGHLAAAFGMHVIYYNTSHKDVPFTKVDLSKLLSESHIISLHLPLTEETKGLLSADSFKSNPHRPILINTARGGIISDDDLYAALTCGFLSAYAGDVLGTEPPIENSPLIALPNVYVTPHSASLTARTYNQLCVLSVQNLLAVLGGDPIEDRFIFNRESL